MTQLPYPTFRGATMRLIQTVAIILMISGCSRSGSDTPPEAKPKPVKVEKTWQGEVKLDLWKEAPQKGYVADKDAWAKLWKAYRGEEKMPEVDFDKELILVAVNSDPNGISIRPEVDDNRDLKVTTASTTRYFKDPKTCRYEFALIKRESIKTIAGKVISQD